MKVFVWYTVNNQDNRKFIQLCSLDKNLCLDAMLEKISLLKLAYTVDKINDFTYTVEYLGYTKTHIVAEFKQVTE